MDDWGRATINRMTFKRMSLEVWDRQKQLLGNVILYLNNAQRGGEVIISV